MLRIRLPPLQLKGFEASELVICGPHDLWGMAYDDAGSPGKKAPTVADFEALQDSVGRSPRIQVTPVGMPRSACMTRMASAWTPD